MNHQINEYLNSIIQCADEIRVRITQDDIEESATPQISAALQRIDNEIWNLSDEINYKDEDHEHGKN